MGRTAEGRGRGEEKKRGRGPQEENRGEGEGEGEATITAVEALPAAVAGQVSEPLVSYRPFVDKNNGLEV